MMIMIRWVGMVVGAGLGAQLVAGEGLDLFQRAVIIFLSAIMTMIMIGDGPNVR